MPRRQLSIAVRAAGSVSAAGMLALLFVACSPEPSAAPTPTEAVEVEVDPSAPPSPEAPEYEPTGTAHDNLPIFSEITRQVWSSDQRASGRAYIDALVSAGFDRTLMQVTADRTTVGNPVESLQFSVRWGDAECLVGQVGPSTGEPVTVVMPQLAEGRCLVGRTQPIDW